MSDEKKPDAQIIGVDRAEPGSDRTVVTRGGRVVQVRKPHRGTPIRGARDRALDIARDKGLERR